MEKVVWIIGDGYIKRLEKFFREEGLRFSSENKAYNIYWFGKGGMKWENVVPKLEEIKESGFPHPSGIVIHCGGNDLGVLTGVALFHEMKAGVSYIMESFPNCKILVSDLIETTFNRHTTNLRGLRKSLRNVNKLIQVFLRDRGMNAIWHKGFSRDSPSLYNKDGVYLSAAGQNKFFKDIRESVLENI